MADRWASLLGAVLGTKESMKEGKAVKRAVKTALEKPEFSSQSSKQLKSILRELLTSGTIPGFRVQDEKLVCVALPVPPIKEKSKKKEKKKEKKRQREKEATTTAATTENEQPEKENQQEEAGPSKPPKKKKQKKKQTVDRDAAAADQGARDSAGPSSEQQPARQTAQQPASTAAPAAAHIAANNEDTVDPEDLRWRADLKRTDVKSGKFSSAEKEALRAAVKAFATARGFSTDDYSWLIATGKGRRSKETLGIWKTVALSLPQRTIKSVQAAGTRMFHPNACQGKWTPEQDAELLTMVEQRGRKWTEIGAALGRTGDACRDRWREEVRLGNDKARGAWTTDEVERLKNAVEEYLEIKKASLAESGRGTGSGAAIISLTGGAGGGGVGKKEEDAEEDDIPGSSEKLDRRIVLDDIDWTVISAKVGSRSNIQCLEKWYDQISPSMVVRGDWGQGDDRRMLKSLWSLGAGAEYEVPWGEVVRGRTAAQARRRWRLMAKVVPEFREKEFPEIVDFLVTKYLPQLKEASAAAAASGGDEEEQEEA